MTIDVLLIEMIKRISLAVVLALLLAQTKLFDRLMTHRLSVQDRIIFIAFFSVLAIAGTYAGIPVNDALANSRMVGIMAAGLMGGPAMGGAVGLIAGVHRYFLGGFTALACGVSSLTEGLLAGIFAKLYPRTPMPWPLALMIGFVGEALQMVIIMVIASPFEMALNLVAQIAIPMTIANSIGLALFVTIINDAFKQRESIAANQSHTVLLIARQTVGYLRKGLNTESAARVVKIIKEHTFYDSVSITDVSKVLSFSGVGADHHSPHMREGLTDITLRTLKDGHTHIAHSHREIGCHHNGCQLHSAIIVPLLQSGTIVGTLKLYYAAEGQQASQADVAFAQGLADLFSTQLELNEIDLQAKQAEESKLKALYAQINPHFLFNTLNTISSLIRTNPDLARRLLIKFSHLFRFILKNTGKIISFRQEWTQVQAFLEISQARQGDKLHIITSINPSLLSYGIPSLTLQPIIENAIKHGLQPRETGGTISIVAYPDGDDWIIDVNDNGIGFEKDPELLLEHPSEGHIGLSNVHQRLRSLYGPQYGLTISSHPEQGTNVAIRLPKEITND